MQYNKDMKKFIVFAAFILAVGIGGFLWFQNTKEMPQRAEQPSLNLPLALEVEEVLAGKISMISTLVQNSVIIEEVKSSNQKDANLSPSQIAQLDRQWRDSEQTDEWINSFLTNNLALKLIEFQKMNPGFPEIFIANAYGLNVGQTNKTTDYYQADEQWWVDAYEQGRGRSLHGLIEFDESAQTEAIAIYVPVRDPATNRAIGVAKAIVDLSAIKAQL